MINEKTLTKETKATLRNRFYAAKNRAASTQTPFAWETFEDWLIDFCQIAPENFNPEDYRVSYDNQAPAGYAVETMRFTPSPKLRQARLRQSIIASATQEEPAKGVKAPKLNGITDLQRMLFTAELTQRLHHFKVDQTFEELVAEAAAAADVELI